VTESTGKTKKIRNPKGVKLKELIENLKNYSDQLNADEEIDVEKFCQKNNLAPDAFYLVHSKAIVNGKELKTFKDNVQVQEPEDMEVEVSKNRENITIPAKIIKNINYNLESNKFEAGDRFKVSFEHDKIILEKLTTNGN